MKTELNILRRIYDNYIPAEQLCNYLEVEFKEKSTEDGLIVRFLGVIMKDNSEVVMMCIHIDSIEHYIKNLQKEFNIDDKKLISFLFLLHKSNLRFQKEIIQFLHKDHNS